MQTSAKTRLTLRSTRQHEAARQDDNHCTVNSDGSYKYLNGLYVIDGSVFPTSLGVNPQLTIYGISARNATRLAEALSV